MIVPDLTVMFPRWLVLVVIALAFMCGQAWAQDGVCSDPINDCYEETGCGEAPLSFQLDCLGYCMDGSVAAEGDESGYQSSLPFYEEFVACVVEKCTDNTEDCLSNPALCGEEYTALITQQWCEQADATELDCRNTESCIEGSCANFYDDRTCIEACIEAAGPEQGLYSRFYTCYWDNSCMNTFTVDGLDCLGEVCALEFEGLLACVDNSSDPCVFDPGPDCCVYATDGYCDESGGTGACRDGTDTTDCDEFPPCDPDDPAPNCCIYANDGVCDEPGGTGDCLEGTDTADCTARPPCDPDNPAPDCCAYAYNNVCDEAGGTGFCGDGTDTTDCNAFPPCDPDNPAPDCCIYANDDYCDEPGGSGACLEGTDTTDCGNFPPCDPNNPAPDCCIYANDGECDEPEGTGFCLEGSDGMDCGGSEASEPDQNDALCDKENPEPNCCRHARDGECDDPEAWPGATGLCDPGTDTADCERYTAPVESSGDGEEGAGCATQQQSARGPAALILALLLLINVMWRRS